MGVFARIMEGLAAAGAERKTVVIDATYLKAHRTAAILSVKKGVRPRHRAHEKRAEHQASCGGGRKGRTAEAPHDRGRGGRLHRSAALLGDLPEGERLLADRDTLRPMPDRLPLRHLPSLPPSSSGFDTRWALTPVHCSGDADLCDRSGQWCLA
jgi:hypothetical protein